MMQILTIWHNFLCMVVFLAPRVMDSYFKNWWYFYVPNNISPNTLTFNTMFPSVVSFGALLCTLFNLSNVHDTQIWDSKC